MQIFYVDRVSFFNRVVPRRQPAFIGWDTKLLVLRERAELRNGGFGFGFVEDQQLLVLPSLLDGLALSNVQSQVVVFPVLLFFLC